ncbi:hypothetical protein BC359_14960 [Priestia flexa]|uniref:Uncharacterized protein n=1 Tax=Priestia veravalensis TaxID=1414648 RepID=A0A0V8JM78_9BACI|nr:hypothetical protein BC359_14960 [Priestia flexa]KSU88127.1 hypothetical protein AS180_09395 [Priestia veravalensis]
MPLTIQIENVHEIHEIGWVKETRFMYTYTLLHMTVQINMMVQVDNGLKSKTAVVHRAVINKRYFIQTSSFRSNVAVIGLSFLS